MITGMAALSPIRDSSGRASRRKPSTRAYRGNALRMRTMSVVGHAQQPVGGGPADSGGRIALDLDMVHEIRPRSRLPGRVGNAVVQSFGHIGKLPGLVGGHGPQPVQQHLFIIPPVHRPVFF